MKAIPDDWTPRLSQAIATAIEQFRERWDGSPVIAFDVGCFPWHGGIELSFLTTTEANADPHLFERSEVAAWTHFNFSGGMESWPAGKELGQQMSALYYDTDIDEGDTRKMLVEAFLRACAEAVATPKVTAALHEMTRDPGFQVWVHHPDTGRPFWPP